MPKKTFFIGLCYDNVSDLESTVADCKEAGFDYVATGFMSQQYRQNELKGIGNNPNEPFSFFDMSLGANDWGNGVVGVLGDVQAQLESPDYQLQNRATKLLEKEIGYIQHLGLHACLVTLNPGESTSLARVLNSKFATEAGSHSGMVVYVRMPMVHEDTSNSNSNSGGNNEDDWEEDNRVSSWHMWNKFRTAVNYDRKIHPVIDIPLDLPDEEEIKRWKGESVKAIVLHEELFTTNSKGFPVLPKASQDLVKSFIELGCQIIIKGRQDKGPLEYLTYRQYVEWLYRTWAQELEDNPIRKYTKGYEDYLQSPLQPLMDNLEASTYEVFERDPIKYELYQEAVAKALLSKVPDSEKDTKTLVVMVVGAGRGPLVRNCLAASENVGRKIKLFAVEKNTNAVCTLLHLKHHVWKDQVTVISSDMREWEPEEKADILVSELLGSFGDNELSPECLDGAQRLLKADGIMIPQKYTSYVSPVMTPKLNIDVRSFQDINKNLHCHYETPYVVYLKNYYEIDKPKPLFTFTHPKPNPKESNDRYGTLEFTSRKDCVLHGLAGYFDSLLFGDILMSIHPDTHSPNMFSWFPIYFPLREPVPVKKGDKIKVHFWRCSNKHNVWYEWSVSSPIPLPVHNANGRSYTIGL